jgi:hypothetical protein
LAEYHFFKILSNRVTKLREAMKKCPVMPLRWEGVRAFQAVEKHAIVIPIATQNIRFF